jgi:peptide/nickel transport system substrate-binding protein
MRIIVRTAALLTALAVSSMAIQATHASRVFGQQSHAAKVSYDPNATITMTTNADPIFDTWDPNAFAESDIINKLIFSGVTKWGLDGSAQGDLASSWSVSKNKLVWTFNLRKGVKWQDGKPFTSADVVYTYRDVVLNKATPTSKASVYSAVKTVRAKGANQVQFVLNSPFSDLPAYLAYYAPVIPKHVLSGSNPFNNNQFNKVHPIGTGPYIMSKYTPGESITLTRNPHYFGAEPKIKKIIFKIIPTTTTEVSNLLSGGLDYINLTDPQYLPPLLNNSNFTVQKNADQTYYFAMVNTTVAPFNDVRVRQALDYAIDKKAMIKAMLSGYGKVASGPIAPLQKSFYSSKVQQYAYSPSKALKLLQAAGYTKDSSGNLMKNGQQLSIDFTAGQIRFLVPASELIQRYWQALGIKVNLKVLDWNTYIQTVVVKRDYQASFAWWSTPPAPDMYSYFSCTAAKGGYNLSGYCNSALDKAMNKGRAAIHVTQQKAAYAKVQTMLAKTVPLMFLFYPDSFNVVRKNLHAPHAGYGFAIDHISDWYVAK